jgi:uncharacterized protein YigE (DUF2233 family)
MKKLSLIAILLISTAFLAACSLSTAPEKNKNSSQKTDQNVQWTEISPGLKYGTFRVPLQGAQEKKDFQVTIIDPKLYNFAIVQNSDKESAKNLKEIQETSNALLTFNGAFFTEDYKPTGLLISKNQELHHLSKADLMNGIFSIDSNNKTAVSDQHQFSPKNTGFAIQNGPLLMLDGRTQIKSDNGKTASRTVIGVDSAGNIVLILVKQSLLNSDNTLTLFELANLLKDSPELHSLNLISALNLDGGPSTGMIVQDQYYPEMEKVQNAVIVTNK